MEGWSDGSRPSGLLVIVEAIERITYYIPTTTLQDNTPTFIDDRIATITYSLHIFEKNQVIQLFDDKGIGGIAETVKIVASSQITLNFKFYITTSTSALYNHK